MAVDAIPIMELKKGDLLECRDSAYIVMEVTTFQVKLYSIGAEKIIKEDTTWSIEWSAEGPIGPGAMSLRYYKRCTEEEGEENV